MGRKRVCIGRELELEPKSAESQLRLVGAVDAC